RYAPETTRPSLSQKTVNILGDIAPAVGSDVALQLTERINRHYAVADGHAPLQVFDEQTVARFKAQYASDLEKIAEQYPDVTILSPQ
ncbi:MAG: hypothetical protein KDJ29_21380, partial [Hyphomicrobiales bacterium]|nr:hypothetical protein [Hyphomicrobiales bacterium]